MIAQITVEPVLAYTGVVAAIVYVAKEIFSLLAQHRDMKDRQVIRDNMVKQTTLLETLASSKSEICRYIHKHH